jgi:hypothetical protein
MKNWIAALSVVVASTSFAETKLTVEKILTDQKGLMTCTGGGSSSPIFASQCVRLNLSRISNTGTIKYEGTCVDANETTYYLSCESFAFEYTPGPSKPKGVFPE